MTWIRRHFERYGERRPWDFCWRITLEQLLVSVVVAGALVTLGLTDPEDELAFEEFLILGVIVAPVLETLLLQAFPIWIARVCGAGFSVQVVISMLLFFIAHLFNGVVNGIAAGLVGGFYFAFTYAHWRNAGRWTAFWTTALSHAMHNGVLVPLIVIEEMFGSG